MSNPARLPRDFAIAIGNPVLLTLVCVAGAAVASAGFVAYAPNRLVSGHPLVLWTIAPASSTAGIAALGAALLVLGFAAPRRALYWGQTVTSAALLLLVLTAAGTAARAIAAGAPVASRVSPGAAFWTLAACAILALGDALQRLDAGPGIRLLVVAAVAGGVLGLGEAGSFAALSIAREYATRHQLFAAAVMRHIVLVAAGVGPALALGFPLGVAVAKVPRWQGPVFAALNIVQTIPSIALFGLLIAPLSALAAALPALAAIGVAGIGVTPAIIALVLYALLPIVRNTAAGIGGVDRAILEVGRGMGMTAAQLFCRVELPLALPVLLAGLRIVVVQSIGLAVIAALIGAGGLGTFVFDGLGQYAVDLVLLGALPTIFLALAADFVLQTISAMLRTRVLR